MTKPGAIRTVWRVLGLVMLLTLCGLCAKKKLYDPKHRSEQARKQADNLTTGDRIREGDLIFHTSLSNQSRAIQLATGSKYSHCGIIIKDQEGYCVFEAVQPVKSTPLERWIARGKNGRYVIKRLKNADAVLTPEVLEKMKLVGKSFRGKDYDLTFEWSDEKIYCSELIWKIYQRGAGVEIGALEKLGDFDLTSQAVKDKMKERYGDNIPLDEPVISPAAIFDSDLLVTIQTD